MKIVHASTEEQEKHIEELIQQMYHEIFPIYFSDKMMEELETEFSFKLHETSNYHGTLKEAFQVMSSLQALIALFENVHKSEKHMEKYKDMYERNMDTLKRYGFKLPLTFEQFLASSTKENMFSRYLKPANKWII